MKKAFGFVLLLYSLSASAEPRQVKVRLFSTLMPASIRIVPHAGASINGVSVRTATQVNVIAGQLAIQGKPAGAGVMRVAGEFTIETGGNEAVHLARPVEIGVDRARLKIIVSEPLEDYVVAVLAGEASTFRSTESLKAMAVAVRSFAVRFTGRHQAEGFDFCDTTHCQDFRSTAVTDRLRAAVDSTEGEVIWFNGRPAATYYHQDCAGHTERGSSVWPDLHEPYLRGQADNYCLSQGRSGWSTELSADELRRAVNAAGVEVAARTGTGRVQQLRLSGARRPLMSAEQFRLSIGRVLGWDRLRSDQYEIRRDGERFRFQGYGAGHGVGLCQAGAARMGEIGRTYREILEFYYPGTKLGVTAQGLTWTHAGGERIDLQTTRLSTDSRVIPMADRLVRQVEQELGRRLNRRPSIRIFPSVATFRDSVSEPGWIAANTRGATIRLQPVETLGAAIEKTLHHELMHIAIEQAASPALPLWFREGLVLVMTDSVPAVPAASLKNLAQLEQSLLRPKTREDLTRAYSNAKAAVGRLVMKYGKEAVLSWVSKGIPADVLGEPPR